LRHTFYGSPEAGEDAYGIALSADHDLFVTGLSITSWLGDGGAAPLHAHSGNLFGDAFVLKLTDRIINLYLPILIR
jgi:hypothetical protein